MQQSIRINGTVLKVRPMFVIYTLSGRLGKVVAPHAEVARSIPG